jgi:hypothetical protein
VIRPMFRPARAKGGATAPEALFGSSGWTGRNLLPVLMVWVLLLCHGFVHLPSLCRECGASGLLSALPTYGHTMVVGASAGDDPAGGPGRVEGGGVLAVFGVLLLALIAATRRNSRSMFSRSFRPSPVFFYRPRGPTLTSLRVLRL